MLWVEFEGFEEDEFVWWIFVECMKLKFECKVDLWFDFLLLFFWQVVEVLKVVCVFVLNVKLVFLSQCYVYWLISENVVGYFYNCFVSNGWYVLYGWCLIFFMVMNEWV